MMRRCPGDLRQVAVVLTVEDAAQAALLIAWACDALDPGDDWDAGAAPLIGGEVAIVGLRSDIRRGRGVAELLAAAIMERDAGDEDARDRARKVERAEERARRKAEQASRAGQDALTPAEQIVDTAPL